MEPSEDAVPASARARRADSGHTAAASGRATTIMKALSALVMVVILLVGGFAWYSMDRVRDAGSRADLALEGAEDGAVDILVVGSDTRTDAQGKPFSPEERAMLHAGDEISTNTDTLLLVRVPTNGQPATAFSIPRDTFLPDSPLGPTKINGVYAAGKVRKAEELTGKDADGQPDADTSISQDTGIVSSDPHIEEEATKAGRQALVNSVEDLTGASIDHYAEVGMLGFVLLTDAVGGVQVCVREDTNDDYSGANFTKGLHQLSGPEALSFVRQRHGLPHGDLDRIARQQAFLSSLVNSALSRNVLADPNALNKLHDAIERSVVLDEGWDVLDFSTRMLDVMGGAVTFETIPVINPDAQVVVANGDLVSAISVDQKMVRSYIQDKSGLPKEEATPTEALPKIDRSQYSVAIENAGTVSGLASTVLSVISELGYPALWADNSTTTMSETTVYYAPGDKNAARVLAHDLGDAATAMNPELDKGTLKVVLAEDYAGPTTPGAPSEGAQPWVPEDEADRGPITAGPVESDAPAPSTEQAPTEEPGALTEMNGVHCVY